MENELNVEQMRADSDRVAAGKRSDAERDRFQKMVAVGIPAERIPALMLALSSANTQKMVIGVNGLSSLGVDF
jgi:hypothetical protein